jgi:hypothetical protein
LFFDTPASDVKLFLQAQLFFNDKEDAAGGLDNLENSRQFGQRQTVLCSWVMKTLRL